MFCKASVLKCSGLKVQGSLQFCLQSPFSNSGSLQLYFVHLLTPLPPKTKQQQKGKCSMSAKTGAKCTKTLTS